MERSSKPGAVERYDIRENQLFLEKFSKTILANVLEYVADKVVLDAGCGSGWAEPILAEKRAQRIDAFDIDEDCIKYAQLQKIKNSTFGVKDFNEQGFEEGRYDIAISIEVIEHLRGYEFYLSNLAKSLKKGGLLFLSTPNKKMSAGQNTYHIQEFTIDEMTNMLGRNSFRIIKINGLSTNELSRIWAKVVPAKITSIIRGSRLYKILVDNFVKFPNQNLDEAESVLYFSEKI
jgi:SAM-dependent methyltransferase